MAKTDIPTYRSTTLVQRISDSIKNGSQTKYCFILGAGASKRSGIKTGAELAATWFNDIKRIFPDHQAWVKDKGINEAALGLSYGKIYTKRFELDHVEGYEFLQREMANSSPSFGFSILVQLLQEQHNVVITTNFDSLVEDALFLYSKKKPLICGHESLSDFVQPSNVRPIIIKVHRDLLLHPKNEDGELADLEPGFAKSLDRIFQGYTPIVIGYGGNDPSLMGYLKGCVHLKGIFWCKRYGDGLSDEIQQLLSEKGGKIFEIAGFDELMFQIYVELFEDKKLDKLVKDEANKKAREWADQLVELGKGLKDAESKESLTKLTREETYKNWWDVVLAVNAATDTDAKETIYIAGLSQFPNSPELLGNYANFLRNLRKNYDEAGRYYLKALELGPDHALCALYNGNYASFLTDIRKDHDEAEKYYLRALELDPDYSINNGNYAIFLKNIRRNYDEAEKYYLKALELDPDHAINKGNYANFLQNIRKNYDEAEKYYLKALELDPEDDICLSNYAQFLIQKGHSGHAATYIDRAFPLAVKNGNNQLLLELWFYRFANFFDQYPKAEKEIKKLIATGVRSDNWDFSGNIEQARKSDHPKIHKVIEYAETISGNTYS